MVMMALEKSNNSWGSYSGKKGAEKNIKNPKELVKRSTVNFIMNDDQHENENLLSIEIKLKKILALAKVKYQTKSTIFFILQMCRDVANILSPKKCLRHYDGEDDVDAFLPKQCCIKSKETYDIEKDFSAVGAVSNEQEELGVLYSDVSNILRKYDSI